MKKIILVIIDGLGDSPLAELNVQTPLQAAKTPNLDFLAKNSRCGLIEPFKFPDQNYPTSDVTHLACFGYNPAKYYLGRGVYEAAGVGMKILPGDICLRANFATVDENLVVLDRRAQRIVDTEDLIRDLQRLEFEGVKVLVKKSFGHRACLILRPIDKKLSAQISDGDPKKTGERALQIKPKDDSKEAIVTAYILNQFLERSHLILGGHHLNLARESQGLLPANFLLVRGAGSLKIYQGFEEKYGLKAAFIAGGSLYKGIGRILGMKEIAVRGANGFVNTNLNGKVAAAVRSSKYYDFIFLHIKACDNLAEDGDGKGKKEFIEKIDKSFNVFRRLKNTLLVVTADHSTCTNLKRHCIFPVPVLFHQEAFTSKTLSDRIKAAKIEKFSEAQCQKGPLKIFSQLKLMKKIIAFAEK